MKKNILVERRGGVAIMTMNRPDRLNALSGDMLDALVSNAHDFWHDSSVRCVVITGAGRGFSAGGDVKSMAEGREFAATSVRTRSTPCAAKWRFPDFCMKCPSRPLP